MSSPPPPSSISARMVSFERRCASISRRRAMCVPTRASSSSVSLGFEWLGDVVDRAQVESAHLLESLVQGGEEHHRDGSRRLASFQPAAGFIAVDARHPHVEEDQVGLGLARDCQCLLTAARRERPIACTVEFLLEQIDVQRLVIDDQDGSDLGVQGASQSSRIQGSRLLVRSGHRGRPLHPRSASPFIA